MKKTWLIIGIGLMLSACGSSAVSTTVPTVVPTAVVKIDGVHWQQVDGGLEVSVESNDRVSAVDFNITSTKGQIISFVPNKDVFTAILSNKGNEKEWEVSMGIMKGVSELPAGKLTLGKLLYRPGSGVLTVQNLKLIGPGVNGKPTQTLMNDVGFSIK